MAQKSIETKAEEFCRAWQGLGLIYDDFARNREISYTTLYILNVLNRTTNCTQKRICEWTLLPKQTVNNVIVSFVKQGFVELSPSLEDKRTKWINMTSAGKAYAARFIPDITKAECQAMKYLTSEEQDQLLKLMWKYSKAFKEEVLEVAAKVPDTFKE